MPIWFIRTPFGTATYTELRHAIMALSLFRSFYPDPERYVTSIKRVTLPELGVAR